MGENKKKVSGYLYKLSRLCFREGSFPLSSQSTLSLIDLEFLDSRVSLVPVSQRPNCRKIVHSSFFALI